MRRKGRWWPGMQKVKRGDCMVPGCETDVAPGDYVCASHSRMKAEYERRFWQEVKDGKPQG